jgi:hypothetical protein
MRLIPVSEEDGYEKKEKRDSVLKLPYRQFLAKSVNINRT